MTRTSEPLLALSSMTEFKFVVTHRWVPATAMVEGEAIPAKAQHLMTRATEPVEALSSVTELAFQFIIHTCEPLTAMSIGMLNLSALALMTRSTEPLLALISMTEFKFATHTLVPLAVMANSGAGSMTCN